MPYDESTHLLNLHGNNENGLSTVFAIICILDVFGVYPVVTLPKAIIDCGFYGILLITLVCSAQIYTANLLGKCWIIAEKINPNIQRKSRYPYAALAETTYGKRLANFVTFLLDLTVFGASIPNLIVASQNLQLLGERLSENTVSISLCYWIIIVGTVLCPVLWLGSPKDMKCLCSTSACMVILVFLLTCGCLIYSGGSNGGPVESVKSVALWRNILEAYGIITFLFDIHPTILTIQVDMRNKYRLTRALLGGFGISLLMFGITANIAAIKYGTNTKSSILDTLPTSIPLHFAATLVAIQLCLTSAVSNNVLYQQMEDCMQIPRDFNPKRCILRTTLTILAIVIAESVPRFDLVMSLIGGTLTGPLVFVLPPLIYMKMLSLQTMYEEDFALGSFANVVYSKVDDTTESSTTYTLLPLVISDSYRSKFGRYCEISFCCCIIISSIVFTLLTTYFNSINIVLSYSNVSKPCIYNVSSFLLKL
ncbi:unnamed protein product [Acanthoscelides obtectus]|uniref:Amino acid transporter transmembrane domain-containing protein n=1 Tax=Acanthoscelides obtectus TaxID=200917 RepID=A0A9P0L4M8_ACAOB|nr:unnamed protein product [Acanthoscelides obtectus]CAK1642046.1 Amino acid transporter AVT1I [Acanthoscelides obtectus]